jgi:glutathione S-transferase
MAANTLSVLMPSVNNLTARIFVRAAGLDFEELDVWGKKDAPEFTRKDPAQLTPMLEEEGLPKGSLWESCAIMQYLCNKHDLGQFYPKDPGERAMVDSAMFYLIGTHGSSRRSRASSSLRWVSSFSLSSSSLRAASHSSRVPTLCSVIALPPLSPCDEVSLLP